MHRFTTAPSALVLLLSVGCAFGFACSSTTDATQGVESANPGATPGGNGSGDPQGSTGNGGKDGGPAANGADSGSTTTTGEGDAGTDSSVDPPPPPPPPPAGPLSPSYVDYDINHVLSTGQSNSVANGGTPILTTTQPFTNIMFNTGVMPITGCGNDACTTYQTPTSFVPLVEGDSFFNYGVETASSGLGNGISNIAQQIYLFGNKATYPLKHDVLVTVEGRSGWTLWCIRKGSCNYKGGVKPFQQSIMDVQNAMALAQAAGKTYAVRAVTIVHGESDHYSYQLPQHPEFPLASTDGVPNAIQNYADGLIELQKDYDKDVRALTGQTPAIPLLVSQISGWTDIPTSKVAQWELDAHIRAPGKVLLIGPTYALDVREDCNHFSNKGQRRLGEYFAKVYSKVVFGGETWEPVRPKTVTRADNVITVKFFVPKPPLVFDTTRVTNPGNYGFTFNDGTASPPTVTNVAITASDTVQITLSATPAGAEKHLLYAQNQPPKGTTCIGPGLVYGGGARGNLRDSDDTPSNYGYDLFNWAVMSDTIIP